MTNQELSQFQFLKKEIEMTKKQIEQLEILASRSEHVFSVLPKSYNSEIRVKKYASEIADLIAALELNLNKYLSEFCKLNDYIQKVDDSMVRQIIIYRFYENYTWVEIADEIGGNNSADGVRKMMFRYLKSKEQKIS